MTVIAIANPKGGCGKSTTALILGTVFAHKGASVCIIDTDPQKTLWKWAAPGQSVYSKLVKYVESTGELIKVIDRASEEHQIIIIDVQGRAAMTMARAMTRADFVIIPTQATSSDANEAAVAISLLREEEETLRKKIPHRVAFMRTSPAISTKEEKEIISSLEKANIPRMKTHLNQRVAFSRLHSFHLSLNELDPNIVNGLPAAIENGERFAAEVADLISNLEAA